MRELLHHLSQTRRDSNVVVPTNSSTKFRCGCKFLRAQRLRKASFFVAVATVALLWPSLALAQLSPWERAASNLEFTFTGPLARSLALVAIVIGGLMFMFGEGGAKRQISGIVFGGGLALFATQFMTWLF
jgi:type IV secretory pathway VirB2 component (pilin)